MSRLLVIIAIVLWSVSAVVPATAQGRASDWSDERGTVTAARLIANCLRTGPATRETNASCINIAFDACTLENGGTMSQYDLNVCRRYSYEAWRERYTNALAGFDRLFQSWAESGTAAWHQAMVARFRRQENAWRQWTVADCEMWELGSVKGTIHSYVVASCEERHVALRTMELTARLDDFEN